jgi:hypothetical protein
VLAGVQELLHESLETIVLWSATPTVEVPRGPNRRAVPAEVQEAARKYKQAATQLKNLNRNIQLVLHSSFSPRGVFDEIHRVYRNTALSPALVQGLEEVQGALQRRHAQLQHHRPALEGFSARPAEALANLTPWERTATTAAVPLAAASARAAGTAPEDPRPAQRRRVEAEPQAAPVAAASTDQPAVDLTLGVPGLEPPSFLEDLDLVGLPDCNYSGDPFSPINVD